MLTNQPPMSPQFALQGVSHVHWPMFFMRSAVRALILWPIVNFVGGVGGVRGVLTSAAGGLAYTGVELAWDAGATVLTAPLRERAQEQTASFFNGLPHGTTPPAQDVIDTFSP